MRQLSEKEAIELYKSEFWKNMKPKAIAVFQLIQKRLCVPFSVFHESVEKAVGRPVFTHEFINPDSLLKEIDGGKTPTLNEIINMLPENKRILIINKE